MVDFIDSGFLYVNAVICDLKTQKFYSFDMKFTLFEFDVKFCCSQFL